VLKPALENGVIVILDRFVLSSVAYQGYGRELGEQLVLDINAPAVDGIKPDLTVLFDMKRKDERLEREKDRIELDGADFFERIYNGYMTAYDRDTTLVIDGGKSIEEIAEAVWKRVEELI
ncbi:MAG: dTMP kinase, partial [Clostridia bacterium]|nr:dTMP kinase [Clostridia bacterium]